MAQSLEHTCPWCNASRTAPLGVLAHPRDIYTVTCDCGEKYEYMYLVGKGEKMEADVADDL